MNRTILLTSFLLLLATAVFGQLNRGALTGTVTDSSGAVVPSAVITIRNLETNAVTKVESTTTGNYTVPNLTVGNYEVLVEAKGFKKFVRQPVALRVTEVLRIDATLEVGVITETVQVTGEVPRLNTDTPEVGTSLSNQNIIDLPLSFSGARSPETFAYKLTPGVTGGSWTSQINGSTSFSKEVLLDGATVSTYLSGHFGESSVSLEALQEFKIQTSGMSAEFGRTQGGVFNFVMKSGANDLHGSAYGALRNEAFNANTWVNNYRGVKRPLDRRQNFAGSFGGPVYLPKVYNGRDRTFFYITYERYRDRTGGFGAPNRTVPLPEFYNGDFSRLLQTVTAGTDANGNPVYRGAIYDPATFRQTSGGRWVGDMFPGNRIPVSRFSQVSQRLNAIAKARYVPTVKDATGNYALANNSVFPLSNTPEFDQHQFSVKMDQMIRSTHKISGSYTYVARPRLLLDQGGIWDTSDPEGGPLSKARRQRVQSDLWRLAYDWTVTPTLLNNINVFYNRMENPNRSTHKDIDGAKELGIKNLSTYGYPAISWGGGPYVTLDNPGDPQNDFQAYGGYGLLNTTSWMKGKHFIKMGFDMRRNYMNTRPTAGGSFSFSALSTAIPNETFSGSQTGYAFASYLLGIVDSAGLGVPVGLGGRRDYTSLFVQDDFKVTRRLTLNIGLRWEFQPPYHEQYDRIAAWSPDEKDPATGRMGAYRFAGNCSVCTGQSYFGTRNWMDFGPRFGFAWQVGDGWAIRGGYGIFYDADLFDGFSAIAGGSSFPWGGSYNLGAASVDRWKGIFNWDNGFPTDRYFPGSFNRSQANVSGAAMIHPDYGRQPYTQSWNLNVQRALPWRLMLDVGYVGNKATRIQNNNLVRLNQIQFSEVQTRGRGLLNTVTNEAQAAANNVAYPFPGYSGTVAGAVRQFPQLRGIETISPYGAPAGFSNYHSLQTTLNRAFSKGFTAYINYVWSKNIANTQSSMSGDNAGALDYYNLALEKAPTTFDFPHNVKGYVQYDLPFGKGKAVAGDASGFWNALISGYSISAIVNYNSGTPIGFGGASNPLPNGWNGGQRPNAAPGDMKNASFDRGDFNFANIMSPDNTYVNKSLFSDAPALTLGNSAPRYTRIRGFAGRNEDIGIMKNNKLGEKFRLQIRAEFLNAFNRHTLGGIQTSVTNVQFGQVTSVSGNRSVQFGMRLDF
jgi:hypothetical protein